MRSRFRGPLEAGYSDLSPEERLASSHSFDELGRRASRCCIPARAWGLTWWGATCASRGKRASGSCGRLSVRFRETSFLGTAALSSGDQTSRRYYRESPRTVTQLPFGMVQFEPERYETPLEPA
jgi:hypothetical protein